MNRRFFMQTVLTAAFAASMPARALLLPKSSAFIVAVYPGTGAAEASTYMFKEAVSPMSEAIAKGIGKKVYMESYRSLALVRSMVANNPADALLVPPVIAVHAMQHGYQPLVRIRDMASGVLIKTKGQTVTRIGMTEPDSWLGAMGANLVTKHKLATPSMLEIVKTQDAVVYLLQQKAVQAAVLRTERANKLIATGEYEIWQPLVKTPDLTLLIHDKLAAHYAESTRQAMLTLPANAIEALQAVIHVPIKQFVPARKEDYAELSAIVSH